LHTRFVSVGATSGLQHIGRQRAPQRFHFVQSSLPPFRTANSVGASSGASRKGRRLMTNATCRISSAPYCIAPNSTFCAHSLDAPCPRDNPEQALNAGVSFRKPRCGPNLGEQVHQIRDRLGVEEPTESQDWELLGQMMPWQRWENINSRSAIICVTAISM
jgi:hypothetical protein